MSRPDRPHDGAQDAAGLRREVTGADGHRYTIAGKAKDWNLGTGDVLLDVAQFVWAFLRRARGKEWVVSVRPTRSGARPITTRRLSTREEAITAEAELADEVESGRLS